MATVDIVAPDKFLEGSGLCQRIKKVPVRHLKIGIKMEKRKGKQGVNRVEVLICIRVKTMVIN